MFAFIFMCMPIVNGVFGANADEVKSVSVMEGHSVTLQTHLNDMQTYDFIKWMYEPKESLIAEFNIRANLTSIRDTYDERFGDKLQLDNQTGSLTITNMSIRNAGLYKLTIHSSKETSYKKISVTVYAHLPVPVIIRDSSQCSSSSERSSKCVLLCSVMNVTHVSLSWYKGNCLLSSISVSDLNIRLSLPLEVEYHDTNTYRCVVNNPITNHTQHLDVNELCQSCSELRKFRWAIFEVVIAATAWLLIILCIAAGVVYFSCKEKEEYGKSNEADICLDSTE
ncbi:natural killer cell receptor 2B4-like isoform X2 [Triplophysa dalaica]|uniref:natural killer cell receptor 2B4-like isoform X2 n=1 Tax=Triplophysa dalaica TaxID=1582913 RepID=UPI0024DFB210|nr:natural killer cell receptor 2B4-like isoform X2 [Triplophysa dalaica]